MNQSRAFASGWTAVWALLMAIEAGVAWMLCDGHLMFTLDDPYIHLAVAENILRGGYGVNAQEFSSPSSSVIYPWLLAGTEALGLGPAGALLINLVPMGAAVWLLLEFFQRQTAAGPALPRGRFIHLMAPLLILALNAVALPLTGMEHSLHVLLVVVAMRALADTAEGQGSGWAIVGAAVLLPLVRFEGLALAFALVVALFIMGRRLQALVAVLAIGLSLAGYAALMSSMGLPMLPSSVMVKSGVAADVAGGSNAVAGVAKLARGLLLSFFRERWGLVLITGLAVGLAALGRKRGPAERSAPRAVVFWVAAFALFAHLCAGQYGWFNRYEVYAVALLATTLIYLWRDRLRQLAAAPLGAAHAAIAIVAATVVMPYVVAVVQTPLASLNVYQQQYQMHRLATEYFPQRVAVNDLGWVAYRNDRYVLDLWGLGSEKARKLRAGGAMSAEAMRRLVEESSVDFAMVYRSWFPTNMPPSWCLMAVLETSRVTSADANVAIYLTNPGLRQALSTALDRWAVTLPRGDKLTRYACAA